MGNIKANTHHAYLNTEIIISSTSPVDDLTDKLTGKKYCIDKEPLVIHLCAGTHCLYSKSLNEKIVIRIEDAIKLGGSHIKGKYVFDNNPWVFITTGDRLYISNVETNEEKVEYNISPEDIIPLNDLSGISSEYFLFITKTDYAIYNVDKDEFVFKFNNHIFSNHHLVIYQQGESIIVYDYLDNNIVVEFNGMYSLGNKLYYVKDEGLYSLNLQNSYISNIKEVGRVDDKCYLYKNMFFRLKDVSLTQKRYEYYNLDESEIKSIVFELPCYIESFDNGITKTHEYNKMCDILNEYEEKISELLKNHDAKYYKKNRGYLDYYLETTFRIIRIEGVMSKNEDGKSFNIFYGKMMRCHKNGRLDTRFSNTIVIKNDKFKVEEISDDDKIHEYENIDDKSSKSSGKSFSGKRYITIDDGIITYHDEDTDKSLPILTKLFDASYYTNAFFTSDGKNIVFKKKRENAAQIMDIECMLQKPFDMDSFALEVKAGTNGYKPEFVIHEADSRVPIWRDPITLKRVERKEMSNFMFKSPDGKYVADNQMITCYFNKYTNEELTFEEYKEFCGHYDFLSDDSDEQKKCKIANRRASLIEYGIEKKYKENRIIENQDEFSHIFIEVEQCIKYIKIGDNIKRKVKIGENIWFLNYVSFSYDSKYLSFGAKKINGGGVFGLYDLEREVMVINTSNTLDILDNKKLRAVWMTMFNKSGDVALYDSCANAFVLKAEDEYKKVEAISGKSLLCFSPSGKYIAFSDQNYIPYSPDNDNWGHQPSGNVFIHSVKNVTDCIQNFNDFASGIDGVFRAKTVASAAFSSDEKRLLAVGNDGVIVIRNLYLN